MLYKCVYFNVHNDFLYLIKKIVSFSWRECWPPGDLAGYNTLG